MSAGITSLPRAALAAHAAAASLDDLGFADLERLCLDSAARHAPDRALGMDPRGGLPVAYSEARAGRLPSTGCVVCDGETCPAADLAELPGGDVAWLTPNLYPVAYPFPDGRSHAGDAGVPDVLHGLHIVHWSSLRHDGGLIGADAATAAALFAQLARAEEWLLHHADEHYPQTGEGHRGHVGIIKNRGRTVGGSVEHDHQQVLLSNVPFAEPPATHGLNAALTEAAGAHIVDEIDGRARIVVPAFMRRPLHCFVVPSEPDVGWLHHLDAAVLDAVALAVARLTLAVSCLMAASGREPAWNLVCHAGAGCGPLFELRAYTQPLGGYEHLGLYICEETPITSAGRLADALAGLPRG
ncbi:MAG: hypothetical protein ACYTG2_15060 [Planctomycetota bacterium]